MRLLDDEVLAPLLQPLRQLPVHPPVLPEEVLHQLQADEFPRLVELEVLRVWHYNKRTIP